MVTYFPSSGEEGWPTAVFAATTSPFGYSSSPEEEKSVTNVSINPINYHL